MHPGKSIRKWLPSQRRSQKKRTLSAGPVSDGWRLPSGEGLEEFALQGGLVAPLMSLRALEMRVTEAARESESESTPAGGCR